MPNPYTSVSISGFNASPPANDGSQTSTNQLDWDKHVDKIGTPLKTAIEAINANVLAAWTSFLATAQTWTADQTIQSTDAGSVQGPNLTLDRYSASPAVNDNIGGIIFRGNDSAAANKTYAQILARIIDPTAGLEDGRLRFQTVIAGTLTDRFFVDDGIWTPNATGGPQGADTMNVSNYFADGVNISTLYSPDTENAIVMAEEFC